MIDAVQAEEDARAAAQAELDRRIAEEQRIEAERREAKRLARLKEIEEQKRNGTYMTPAEQRKRELEHLKLQQMIDGMVARGTPPCCLTPCIYPERRRGGPAAPACQAERRARRCCRRPQEQAPGAAHQEEEAGGCSQRLSPQLHAPRFTTSDCRSPTARRSPSPRPGCRSKHRARSKLPTAPPVHLRPPCKTTGRRCWTSLLLPLRQPAPRHPRPPPQPTPHRLQPRQPRLSLPKPSQASQTQSRSSLPRPRAQLAPRTRLHNAADSLAARQDRVPRVALASRGRAGPRGHRQNKAARQDPQHQCAARRGGRYHAADWRHIRAGRRNPSPNKACHTAVPRTAPASGPACHRHARPRVLRQSAVRQLPA